MKIASRVLFVFACVISAASVLLAAYVAHLGADLPAPAMRSVQSALQMLQTKAVLLPSQWASGIAGNAPGTGVTIALGLFGLTALAAAGWRARRGHVDGVYALGYVGLVLVWPYPAETTRLFMPYLCLAMAQVCLAAHDIWEVNTDFEYHEEQRIEPPAPASGAWSSPVASDR